MSATATITQTSPAPADILRVEPLPGRSFGARIILPSYAKDPKDLNDADFDRLYKAVHTYLVVVLPGLADLDPTSQYLLTKRFDPTCEGAYGHSKEFRHEKSVLRNDGSSVIKQPQVQILGQGNADGHEGVEKLTLRHPTHMSFHKTPLSEQEMADGYTRFYRWHIDSALYELAPPVITTLLGIDCPSGERQKIKVDNSDVVFESDVAATAFISGADAFDSLSDELKQFALGTTVVYAPHPYIYISGAKATSDGFTMVSEGLETPLDELPPWEDAKIKRLPLVWTNPVTGRHHLQVHGCCIWKLETPNGVQELDQARQTIHSLMTPQLTHDRVYLHDWQKGDLVIFFNRGVWHSVTGQFGPEGHRLMHQCNIASGVDPVCVK
ncbi:hypothetical protein BZA70DRAFT_273635 [Myxozyma melibiosi]|uniref:TauD/TfdA-like domain-containing protein n=1 Tax=Myxozyma melibiosi TaxID=54550 RepID=A0ABR1FFW9_9ASCO